VAVHDVERVDTETLVIVMELVPGSDLRTWLRATPRP
jgi:hypothetical protein